MCIVAIGALDTCVFSKNPPSIAADATRNALGFRSAEACPHPEPTPWLGEPHLAGRELGGAAGRAPKIPVVKGTPVEPQGYDGGAGWWRPGLGAARGRGIVVLEVARGVREDRVGRVVT
jgi:hypothetical protein